MIELLVIFRFCMMVGVVKVCWSHHICRLTQIMIISVPHSTLPRVWKVEVKVQLWLLTFRRFALYTGHRARRSTAKFVRFIAVTENGLFVAWDLLPRENLLCKFIWFLYFVVACWQAFRLHSIQVFCLFFEQANSATWFFEGIAINRVPFVNLAFLLLWTHSHRLLATCAIFWLLFRSGFCRLLQAKWCCKQKVLSLGIPIYCLWKQSWNCVKHMNSSLAIGISDESVLRKWKINVVDNCSCRTMVYWLQK